MLVALSWSNNITYDWPSRKTDNEEILSSESQSQFNVIKSKNTIDNEKLLSTESQPQSNVIESNDTTSKTSKNVTENIDLDVPNITENFMKNKAIQNQSKFKLNDIMEEDDQEDVKHRFEFIHLPNQKLFGFSSYYYDSPNSFSYHAQRSNVSNNFRMELIKETNENDYKVFVDNHPLQENDFNKTTFRIFGNEVNATFLKPE